MAVEDEYNFNLPWQARSAQSNPTQYNLSDYGSKYAPTLDMFSNSYDPNRLLMGNGSSMGMYDPQAGQGVLNDYKIDLSSMVNPTAGIQGAGLFGGNAGLGGSFLQQTNKDGSTYGGWGSAGLGLAQSAYGLYQGYQQGKRSDKMFQAAQARDERDFSARKTSYNSQLHDRQTARAIDNPGGNHLSADEYVNKWGIK